MKLIIDQLLLSIDLSPNKVTTLILENTEALRMVTADLIAQDNGNIGSLKLFEKDKPLSLAKSVLLILNPYMADLNCRKFLQLTYSELEEVGSEFSENQSEVLSKMTCYLSKICDQSRFCSLDFSATPDWSLVFKAWGLHFEPAVPGLLPSLIQYMQLASAFSQYKLLVFLNLKQYLLPEEQMELFKMARYLNMTVLLIESVQTEYSNLENLIIIDKDFCEIQSAVFCD